MLALELIDDFFATFLGCFRKLSQIWVGFGRVSMLIEKFVQKTLLYSRPTAVDFEVPSYARNDELVINFAVIVK